MTKDKPAAWACEEICRRTGEDYEGFKAGRLSSGVANVIRVAAEILEEHEEPPVDPLDAAIGHAFDTLPPCWNREIFIEKVGKSLRDANITKEPTP